MPNPSIFKLKFFAVVAVLFFSLGMHAGDTFTRITTLDELVDGEYILVTNTKSTGAASNKYYAMTSTDATFKETTNNKSKTFVGFEAGVCESMKNNEISGAPEGVMCLTFTKKDEGYTIRNADGKYLNFTKTSSTEGSTMAFQDEENICYVEAVEGNDGGFKIRPLTKTSSYQVRWKMVTEKSVKTIKFYGWNTGNLPAIFKKQSAMGDISFNPPSGTTVNIGDTVRISCEGAKSIYAGYTSDSKLYDPAKGIVITEDCDIVAYALSEEGVKGNVSSAYYSVNPTHREFKNMNTPSATEAGAKFAFMAHAGDAKLISSSFLNKDYAISFAGGTVPGGNFSTEEQALLIKLENADEDGKYMINILYRDQYLGFDDKNYAVFVDKADAAIFSINYTEEGLAIVTCDKGQLYFQNNADAPYLIVKENVNSNISLARFIDNETYATPDLLYLYGTFGTGDWNLNLPYEQSTNENGCKDFDAVWIPATAAGHFMFSTYSLSANTASRADIDWATINKGIVYGPEEADTPLEEGKTYEMQVYKPEHFGTERPPYFVVPKNAEYSLHLDFNNYRPTIAVRKTGDIPTGVEEVEIEAAEAEYYNLQGIRIPQPTSGIYLKRVGTKVEKLIK